MDLQFPYFGCNSKNKPTDTYIGMFNNYRTQIILKSTCLALELNTTYNPLKLCYTSKRIVSTKNKITKYM